MNENNNTNIEEQKGVPSMGNYMVNAKEVRTDFFDPVIWQQMKGMADTFKASGALGANENAGTLVMKIQAGYEMGMKPIESIKSFYFVNGVLSIFGAATTKRLREHGWKIEYTDEPNKCTCTISKGDEVFTDSLTFEEAVKSRWTNKADGSLKAGWYEGANRKLKLRYGVTSMLIKTYVPEVLGSATDIAEVAEDTTLLYEPKTNGKAVEIPTADTDDQLATEAQIKTVSSLAKAKNIEVDPDWIMSKMTQREAKEQILQLSKP